MDINRSKLFTLRSFTTKTNMSKIRSCRGQPPTCPVLLRNVVETLFPIKNIERQNIEMDENEYSADAIDPVTDNKVNLGTFWKR